MPGNRDVIELEERKRLLVLQADLHRTELRAELASVRARLQWVQSARDKVGAASPWLALGAGVAGILAARKWRNVVRWIPTALAAVRWIRKLRADSK
jgi:hypothetical protein